MHPGECEAWIGWDQRKVQTHHKSTQILRVAHKCNCLMKRLWVEREQVKEIKDMQKKTVKSF